MFIPKTYTTVQIDQMNPVKNCYFYSDEMTIWTMNPFLLVLTKLHILSLGGRFIRAQSLITSAGEEQEVVVFSGAKPLYTGQCTPFKTAVLHEEALNNKELLEPTNSNQRNGKTSNSCA